MVVGYGGPCSIVYLIPPCQVVPSASESHRWFRKLSGFIAADRFAVHVTIGGFSKAEGGFRWLLFASALVKECGRVPGRFG